MDNFMDKFGTRIPSERQASDVWWFVAGISEDERTRPSTLPRIDAIPRNKTRPTDDYIVCRECIPYVTSGSSRLNIPVLSP